MSCPSKEDICAELMLAYQGLDADDSSERPPVVRFLYRSVAESTRKGKKVKRQPIYCGSPGMGSGEALNW